MNKAIVLHRNNRIKGLLQGVKGQCLAEQMYLVALCLVFFAEMISSTMFEIPTTVILGCKVLGMLLVLLKLVLFDQMSVRRFWITLFCLGLGGMIVVQSGYTDALLWIIMIFGTKGVSWKKILTVYLLMSVSIVLLAFFASQIGVIENIRVGRQDDPTIIRNSFGIIYPTDFSSHIFYILVTVFYVLRDRLKLWHFLAGLAAALLLYKYCYTRLDVGCIILMVIIFGVLTISQKHRGIRKFYKEHSAAKRFLPWIMPLAAVIMLAASYAYRDSVSILVKINDILSDRLMYGRQGIDRYGTSLFGQYVEMNGGGGNVVNIKEYFFVDCSYLYIALRYGVIFLLLVLAVYVLCGRKFRKDVYFLAALVVISVNCMIAHHLVEMAYNPFALAWLAAVPELVGPIGTKGRKYEGAEHWHEEEIPGNESVKEQ